MSNTPPTDNIVDEILTSLENIVSIDTAQRVIAHKSGQSPKKAHMDAKQSLRTLVEKAFDEVIGKSESVLSTRFCENQNDLVAKHHKAIARNDMKFTQRQRAKAKLTEMFGGE